MKVYDCFTFNDELDLLELRLETLDPVVDTFVLVELPITFRLTPKPLYFQENSKRFERWSDKIVVISPKSYVSGPHPVTEHAQRRLISEGIKDAGQDDYILIGDVDEIPDPKPLKRVLDSHPDHPMTFHMLLYYYFVNTCRVGAIWPGTVLLPRSCKSTIDPEDVRQRRMYFPRIEDGGWHFSWLGTPQMISNKLRSIDVASDAILYNTPDIVAPDPDDTNLIAKRRDSCGDLLGREGVIYSEIPVEPGLFQPSGIIEWLSRYPHYAK